MSEGDLHAALVWLMFGLAPVTAVALLFVTAPYGRHRRPAWGPTIPVRLGWVVMESPAVLLFVAVFSLGAHAVEAAPLALLGLWKLHYFHRAFVYPLRMRGRGQKMPLTIAAMAFAFNFLNAYNDKFSLSANFIAFQPS